MTAAAATPTFNGKEELFHSEVDVLIIGAGPAGVMVRVSPCSPCSILFSGGADLSPSMQAADILARYHDRGVSVRIIDKRSGALDNGKKELVWGRRCMGCQLMDGSV